MNANRRDLKGPTVLCVLDGWGHREDPADNAIVPANTPNFERIRQASPHTLIDTSGTDVGLPSGQMGNSEVGHMNLGAGRVVNQDIRRIDAAIEDGSLTSNPSLIAFADRMTASGGTCHLMGLLSPGGVHSHQDHIVSLAAYLQERGIPVAVHGFLDGRDTPPSSAAQFVASFERQIAGRDGVRIATLCGRFYAMDRDQRWERVEQAYRLLTAADGADAGSAADAIRDSYDRSVTDEFMEPAVIGDYQGMSDGDGVLMANFRADRAREILLALLDPEFVGFERGDPVRFQAALGIAEYSTAHNALMDTMFPPETLQNILGELISEAGRRQLRIAETEKYAHVTFFFNGGSETPFAGEDRVLIPSPKVATYDQQPEMSAAEVSDRLVSEIASGKYDFILVNFANPDMVGHTGQLKAAETAIRCVDSCLARVETAVRDAGGTMLVTADHGNAEMMRDPETGEPHTAHTLNPVPLVLVNPPAGVTGLRHGRLADIAPTLLDLMGMEPPAEMSGRSLLADSDVSRNESDERVPA